MSTRSLGTLTLDLVARIGGFVQGMDKAAGHSKKRAKDIEKSISQASNAIKGLMATLAVGVTFNKVIQETIAFQNEQAQLTAVLRSTGEAAGYSQQQLNAMADSMSRASTVSAGEINQAQTNLLSFTGIVGEEFPRALQAAIDMASRTGMSVTSAAETVGRALDVPSQGLAALSRQGFRFTEDQKELAKYLEKTGRSAEAQAIILEALEESYGGAAQAARDTLGGALAGLSNEFSSLLTGESGVDDATAAINELTDTLADPRIKEAFGVIVSGVFNVMNAVAQALPHVVGFTTWAAEELAAAFGGAALDDIVRMEDELKLLEQRFGDLENIKFSPDWVNAITGVNDDLREAQERARVLRSAIDDFYNRPAPTPSPVVAGVAEINEEALLAEAAAAAAAEKAHKEAMKSAERARQAAAQAEKSRLEGIERELTALERAAETWHMTADQVKIYDLAAQGATETQRLQAQALLDTVAALEAQKKAQEEYDKLVKDDARDVASVMEYLLTEEEKLAESYERRRQIVLDSITLAEEEKTALLLELEEDRQNQLAEAEARRTSMMLANYGQLFDGLSGMAAAFAGEQSGIARAMFAVSKAFAVADAVVKIQQGIAAAAALPFPANIPAMATVAASTASIVSTIQSTNLVGQAHDGIMAVPESGTWNLKKGERVTTQETTAKLDRTLDEIRSNQSGPGNVQIINTGQPVSARTQMDGNTLKIFLDAAENRFAESIASGRGKFGPTLEGAYGMRRVGR